MSESNPIVESDAEPLFPGFGEELGRFLLLPRAEVERRVKNGTTLKRLEQLREAVVMLLPVWSLRDIATRLGVGVETLRQFAVNEAEKVGTTTAELKAVYRSKSLRWAALAQVKEDTAQFRDLVLASKLFADIAIGLEATGLIGDEKVVKENRDRQLAAAQIRQLMESVGRPVDESSPESVSVGGDSSVPGAAGAETIPTGAESRNFEPRGSQP
jgi:hypothetical protein